MEDTAAASANSSRPGFGAIPRRLRRGLGGLAALSGAEPRIAVRETASGYSIEEPLTLRPRCARDRMRLALVGAAVAAAAAGGWLAVALALPEGALWPRALLAVQSGCVVAVLALIALMRGVHRVEVDLDRRRFRLSRRIARCNRSLGEVRFGAATDLVLQRGRDGRMSLRLRVPGQQGVSCWHHIASGQEEQLRTLHRRIARDLEPLEARTAMARDARARRPGTAQPARAAFPALGPHELGAA